MKHNVFETILGAIVLALAALFLHKVKGYKLSANFPMVDGLKDGTDVKINGVKVGSISSLVLNTDPGQNQYLVTVTMTVNPSVQLPTDTIALVSTESLLGGKYMSLEPGVDETMIKTDGTGKVTRTQAPLRLDDLIGQLIYSGRTGAPLMRKGFIVCLGLMAFVPCAAHATVPTQEQPIAVIRALDKMTARVEEIELPLNQHIQFGKLTIVAHTCRVTLPEEAPPESAAYLEISELKPGAQDIPVFNGWMFASSPALSAMEHPIYDIWVTGCRDKAKVN
jgi:phospholipid/cholesterol/gamma-HCH transport system substrate-binding protein